MAEHTPGPTIYRAVYNVSPDTSTVWTDVNMGTYIDRRRIAVLIGPGHIDRAAFIVRACNSHEELLAAVQTIAGEINAWASLGGDRPQAWAIKRAERLYAAIRRAEGDV
jgi:hypothetical protein